MSKFTQNVVKPTVNLDAFPSSACVIFLKVLELYNLGCDLLIKG